MVTAAIAPKRAVFFQHTSRAPPTLMAPDVSEEVDELPDRDADREPDSEPETDRVALSASQRDWDPVNPHLLKLAVLPSRGLVSVFVSWEVPVPEVWVVVSRLVSSDVTLAVFVDAVFVVPVFVVPVFVVWVLVSWVLVDAVFVVSVSVAVEAVLVLETTEVVVVPVEAVFWVVPVAVVALVEDVVATLSKPPRLAAKTKGNNAGAKRAGARVMISI